jgi:hypothetical protein
MTREPEISKRTSSRTSSFLDSRFCALAVPRRLDARPQADKEFAEVASVEQADKGCGRILQAVRDVFPLADTAVRDAGSDLA